MNKKFIDNNQRLDSALANCKKRCKCGHTQVVPISSKREYTLCKWCGRRLYWDNAKQKEYDKKSDKNNFMFMLNKCLDNAKKEINKSMSKGRVINKKKLKRKYFKNNADYFTFCKDATIQIYIVDTTSKAGKIIVYYGAKLGRPPKQKDRLTPQEYKKRKRYFKNSYNR